MATIIYTLTDEAPMLATYSFLPVVQAFASSAGVDVETRDISLAGRILALFPEHLTEEQRIGDDLAELGELATTPEANIIKLPNVSASMPQLKAAIRELQGKGFALPDYPDDPQTDARARHPRPVRQGQGQRGQPGAARGQLRPSRARRREELRAPATRTRWGPGARDSRTEVATMGIDDFRDNEQSVVLGGDDTLTIRHVAADGTTTVLKDGLTVLEGEVVDATVMRVGRARRVPARADRPRQGRRRAVLGAPQGHDDEGQRPDHLRPRRPGVPAGGLRDLRRRPGRGRAVPQQRPRRHPRRPLRPAQRRRDQGRHQGGPRRRPAPGDGQLRQGHHQPARARATSSSTRRCRR